jgi:hypothetical protein
MHKKRFSNLPVFLWRLRKIVGYCTVLTYIGKIHEKLINPDAGSKQVSNLWTWNTIARLNIQIFCSFSAIMTPESVVPSINF